MTPSTLGNLGLFLSVILSQSHPHLPITALMSVLCTSCPLPDGLSVARQEDSPSPGAQMWHRGQGVMVAWVSAGQQQLQGHSAAPTQSRGCPPCQDFSRGSKQCWVPFHTDTEDRHCTAPMSLCKVSEAFREPRKVSSQQTPLPAHAGTTSALQCSSNSAVLQSGLQ